MIPKIIHYCWFGHGQKSELMNKCINSWKKYCPEYEIKEWNEYNSSLDGHPFTKRAYSEKKYSFVSDYIRLKSVFEEGGIYLDTDVELLKSLNPLLCNDAFIGTESQGSLINPGSGFGAHPRHPAIEVFLDAYKDLDFENDDGVLRTTPIPCILTPLLIKKGFVPNNKIQTIEKMLILPTEYLCPKDYDGVLRVTENTYSIHHFTGTWVDERMKKDNLTQSKIAKFVGGTISVYAWYLVKMYRRKGFSWTLFRIPFLINRVLREKLFKN